MSNRLQTRLSAMQRRGDKAFVVYLPAGDPDLATTEKLLPALEQAGADVIELGVPFSTRWPTVRQIKRQRSAVLPAVPPSPALSRWWRVFALLAAMCQLCYSPI